ncbi:hypothetical protein D3C81_2195860 [compost metagenome]
MIEIPVTRSYPKGKVPTKISPLRGNWLLIKILMNLFLKKYDVVYDNGNGNSNALKGEL